MSYIVTGPCAQVKYTNEQGQPIVELLYQGATVPATASKESVDHNVAVGLVTKIENEKPARSSSAKS